MKNNRKNHKINKKWTSNSLNSTQKNQILNKITWVLFLLWWNQLILKANLLTLSKNLKCKIRKNLISKDIQFIFLTSHTKLKFSTWQKYWIHLITKKMPSFNPQQAQEKHYAFFLPLWVGFKNNSSKLMNKFQLFICPELIPNLPKFKNNLKKLVSDLPLRYLVQEIYSA